MSSRPAVAIVFMGMISGQITSLAPDYAKVAQSVAANLPRTCFTYPLQAMAGAKRSYTLLEDYKGRSSDKKQLPSPPITGEILTALSLLLLPSSLCRRPCGVQVHRL